MYINYTQRARRNVTQEIEEVFEKWSKVFGSKGGLLERGENVEYAGENTLFFMEAPRGRPRFFNFDVNNVF